MSRHRSFIASDNIGKPCSCLECQAAGVTHLAIVCVPPDEFCSKARWLHGDELRRWYEAREEARTKFKALKDSHAFGGGR